MRLALKPHPDFPCPAVDRIEVEAMRPRRGTLELRYVVTGRIGDLILPPFSASARADNLWEHTCFEAFIRARDDVAYHEFNFAPSGDWAAYRFAGYRSGVELADIVPRRIETRFAVDRYELGSTLEGLSADAPWLLGLSAVIEETNGHKSWWALAHPPGKADFHHPVSFAHELP